MNRTLKHQEGLSLIEALIALLVLSIGLVGMGALMLTSLKNVHSSAHYSAASAIALDFEELLWSRMGRTVAGDLLDLESANGCLKDTTIESLATDLTNEWKKTAADGGDDAWTDAERFKLPIESLAVGDTTTTEVPSGQGVFHKIIPVTLTWKETRFANEASGETYSAEIVLPCRPTFLDS